MMKIDAEKFLAMTVLLATTAGAPACGKKDDAKKTEVKTDAKAVPAAPAAPAPTTPTLGPGPAAQPPAATPEAVAPPAADSAGAAASAGGAAAKPDPGPEEEKPSW